MDQDLRRSAGAFAHAAGVGARAPFARNPARPVAPFALAVDRHPAIAAVVVALANLGWKLPGLAQRCLWLDEAWTVALGAQKPAAIVFAAANDQNPPLYNLLMVGWFQLFGTSEAALRMPSVLASVACAVLLLLFVRRFYGSEAAVYASLLFFVAGAQSYYATEGRAYAIVGLLCVLSFHLYLRNLERPGWPGAILLGVVNAVALYTHYTIGLAYVAQGLCALAFVRTNRRAFGLFVASQLLALALFAPFVPFLLANLPRTGTSWLAGADLSMLYAVIRELVGSKSALRFGLLLLAGSILWRLVARRRGRVPVSSPWDQRVVVAAAWAIVPILLAFVISQRSPILLVRYELFASLGWIVLMAALLAALPLPAWLRLLVALVFIFLSAKASPQTASRDPEWRDVVAIARQTPSDLPAIVVVPAVECIPFAYYAQPAALPALFQERGEYDFAGLLRQLADERIFCLEEAWAPPEELLSQERMVVILAHVERPAAERILSDLETRGYAIGRATLVAGKSIYNLTSTRGRVKPRA